MAIVNEVRILKFVDLRDQPYTADSFGCVSKLDFGQFRQRAGERILQGKLIRWGTLLLSRLGRDVKEIDTPRILPFEPSLTR